MRIKYTSYTTSLLILTFDSPKHKLFRFFGLFLLITFPYRPDFVTNIYTMRGVCLLTGQKTKHYTHTYICIHSYATITSQEGGEGDGIPIIYPPLPTPLTINSQSDTILPPETSIPPVLYSSFLLCPL